MARKGKGWNLTTVKLFATLALITDMAIGVAMFGTPISYMKFINNYSNGFGEGYMKYPVCSVLHGFVLMGIAAVGLFGVFRSWYSMICLANLFLLGAAGSMLGFGAVIFTMRFTEDEFRNVEYYINNVAFNDTEKFKTFEQIQDMYSCCGAHGFKDYIYMRKSLYQIDKYAKKNIFKMVFIEFKLKFKEYLHRVFKKTDLPPSCCIASNVRCHSRNKNTYYRRGCVPPVSYMLEDMYMDIGGVMGGFSIAVFYSVGLTWQYTACIHKVYYPQKY